MMKGGNNVEYPYMTEELRQAMNEIARKRKQEDVAKYSEQLYRMLKQGLEIIRRGTEQERLIKTVDRCIGKTYAIIKLSLEENIPVVVRSHDMGMCIQREAMELFNAQVRTISLGSWSARGRHEPIVLKEEGASVEAIYREFGKDVRIIGISSFMAD
jgi:phosphoenolpyruvate carboxylase